MMAALAAMGGIASTYINMIGDFFQGLLGFAGTTQWAAGLHIIWIMLAAALINKPGAATATGIIKGFVELLSGNTHGLLVLIIDIAAGLIVDLILLPQKDKKPGVLFLLAAGLASASNILIFQFFASIPKDVLTFFVILISSTVSFFSGVIFGGLLVKGLLASLEKAGFYKTPRIDEMKQKIHLPMLIGITALILVIGSGWFYLKQQAGNQQIAINGDVSNPYIFPEKDVPLSRVEVQAESNGVNRNYTGYRLSEIIDFAQPIEKSGVLQVTATDGYSFFISMEEVYSNENLILNEQQTNNATAFNIVGAESTKAWIRGVSEIKLTRMNAIAVTGAAANPFTFHPDEWVADMDSTNFSIDGEPRKLQGVPLDELWKKAIPENNATVMVITSDSKNLELEKSQFLGNDSIRIFINLLPVKTRYLVGTITGEILIDDVNAIEIK